MPVSNESWKKIFKDHEISNYDFNKSPFKFSAAQIKKSCQDFKKTAEKEPRLLCKQDTREDRPDIFNNNHNLFLLPVKNGLYNIIKGEGYVDIPSIQGDPVSYESTLDFPLDTSKIGNSEMQHLDYAYATGLIKHFVENETLVLTVRGRKFIPKFSFNVGKHEINVSSVQTEVDAGYEGKDKLVLIESKNTNATNTIIRQLFYPFRKWSQHTQKKIITLFFHRSKDDIYSVWQFVFKDPQDYNSIELKKKRKFKIIDHGN